MLKQLPKCPKCQGTMEEGFIIDRMQGGALPESWFRGLPDKSFWFGTVSRGITNYQIAAFRCTECGFLESFAIK